MPGPYVQVAAFCEKVLNEKDAVPSLIRIVDRITVSVTGREPPGELPEGVLNTTLVVFFKADDAKGRHVVTIRPQQPSGVYLNDHNFDLLFEGEERGVNLILNMGVAGIEGLYWFEVLVNDRLMTKVPLRVIYQRVPTSS